MAIRAKVTDGRIVVNEPTGLPEGTVLDLVLDDEGDELDQQERDALNAAISRAWASAESGKLRPAAAVLDGLRERK